MLGGTLALGLASPWLGRPGGAAEDPAKQRLQPGDVLVHAYGDDHGELIDPEALPLGGPQELAFPMDPATQTVRDGSRLNLLAVARFDPATLSEATQESAADGVVAYSAICTHQACFISMWEDEKRTLFCSCHASQFDPRNQAEVVDGPAPRRLAALPLATEDGKLVVAGPFDGPIGAQRT